MDWISAVGRRFWLAYTEGLVMTCPVYRIVCDNDPAAKDSPCHIDMRQYDVHVALQQSTTVRH
ncbi:hypothetical protein OLX02_15060 [Novosphingobium sp. KCTC 2891]|uniref:hypothetical protein n=1 Tax=Novosphingobium sp. KCTC 2891 TaxID=2989730 RepID=UPI002222B936|nr:hypothetical protein [Novosphingobium sp. KCTC 2891]MCW1384141.1 hypothetical protein [Novosphingobium sp. KCTC 2891]